LHVNQKMFHFARCTDRAIPTWDLVAERERQVRLSASECLVTIRPEISKVRKSRQIRVIASTVGRSNGAYRVNYLCHRLANYQRHEGPGDLAFSPYDDGRKGALLQESGSEAK
jgi:hypothetical protein